MVSFMDKSSSVATRTGEGSTLGALEKNAETTSSRIVIQWLKIPLPRSIQVQGSQQHFLSLHQGVLQ